ncbi:MAG: Hsp20/alpha crystallin family protein [Anaerolineae bacterium]|nr:Hsp20/alpha crystallin family protein [Anaerolineae bacterium]
MTDKNLDVTKQEVDMAEGVERTRSRRAYIPAASIYESEDKVVVVADLPGVDEQAVDITLEKNELTISAYVEARQPEGYTLAYAEYESGDYRRTFILSDEVDRDNIEASVKDGVLRLVLPKAPDFKARKIMVKAG